MADSGACGWVGVPFRILSRLSEEEKERQGDRWTRRATERSRQKMKRDKGDVEIENGERE